MEQTDAVNRVDTGAEVWAYDEAMVWAYGGSTVVACGSNVTVHRP